MAGKRITIEQAQARWNIIEQQVKLLVRSDRPIKLPSIDLKQIYGNRISMDVEAVIRAVADIISKWNPES